MVPAILLFLAQSGGNDFTGLLLGLTNLGGGFALAAAILYLHRDSLKAFREEMTAERKINNDNQHAFLDMKLRQHEDIVRRLVALEALIVNSTNTAIEKVREIVEDRGRKS